MTDTKFESPEYQEAKKAWHTCLNDAKDDDIALTDRYMTSLSRVQTLLGNREARKQ
jgi:hypothetical protein